MNNYYVYVYLNPIKSGQYKYGEYEFEYEPFYVGKGKGNRLKNIINRSKYFKRIINKIEEIGLKPITVKIKENLDEEKSFILESKLINLIGRKDLNKGSLINFTDGGEGSSGYKFSEESLIKMRKSFSYIKKEFEKRGYKLLSEENEYKDNKKTKLKYICKKCKHEHFISWNDFQQGYGCPYCAKLKIDFSDIKREFERRDYILLSEKSEYETCYTKLKYKCPKNHINYMNWTNFQQGHNCPICWKESINENKGEYSPNHKLTEQDVIKIKLLLKEGKLTQQEIADMFGVSKMTISNIKTGKSWNY